MELNEHLTEHVDEFERLLRQEKLILAVTDTLTQSLQEAGMTKAELAKRLGRSPGFVSQLFGGGRNLTLRTIADIATALSLYPTFTLTHDLTAPVYRVPLREAVPAESLQDDKERKDSSC